MSESKTKGRCRREMEEHYVDKAVVPNRRDWILADAIDRLAADVAAVKEAVCDGSVAAERDRFLSGWGAAIRERDETRAEVERLRGELAARPAAAGWLTEEERQILKNLLLYQWGGLGWLARVAPALRAILDRAGSPPVVEVPALNFLGSMTGREQGIVQAYRDALDRAGIAWKEVPRE